MSYGMDVDDMAKISVANLLKDILEQQKITLDEVNKISEKLEDYITQFRNGRLTNADKIVYYLNKSLAILSGEKYSQSQLERSVLMFIEHLSRKNPLPDLTNILLTDCQKALTIAITGHFNRLEQLKIYIMSAIVSNTTMLKKTTLVPDAMYDALDEIKDSRQMLEDKYS